MTKIDNLDRFFTKDTKVALETLERDIRGSWCLVPSKTISGLLSELRGKDDHDYMAIVEKANTGEENLVQFTALNKAEQASADQSVMRPNLQNFVSSSIPTDFGKTGTKAIKGEGGYSAVYVAGNNGLIGVGYYDNMHSSKGLKMAALICYLFGLLNMHTDQKLAERVFYYLPFSDTVNCDWTFVEWADELFIQLARQ